MGVVLDQLPGLVAGIVTGLISGVISGLWVARVLGQREQRRQVRTVTADVTRTWAAMPGSPNNKVMTGGCLTVRNSSDWPVRNVIVMEPAWLQGFDLRYLGPGREHVEPISHDALIANPEIDPSVTLQVTDIRGKVYQWRPTTDELFDPSWIPLHSRLVQMFARRWPNLWSRRFNPLMMRLPGRVLIWLWGYHPATGENGPHLPRSGAS